MISIEDEKLEKFVMSGMSCIAVPIEIYVPASGEVQITAYRACRAAAEELEATFKGRETSKEALLWLDERLYSFAEKSGFTRFHSDEETMLEYEISDVCQLNKNIQTDNCIMIDDNDILAGLCRNTGCDITIEGGDDVIFAVVKDGRILSYAGVNDLDCGENALEISVETEPAEMRRGYGAACVSALCRYLLSRGYKVLYKCSGSNTASAALAEKCGFGFAGTRYSCTYERN